MRTNVIKEIFFFFILTTAFGCSDKNDDPAPHFPGVPIGEIVAADLRNEILTGSKDVAGGRIHAVLKWWKHDISKFDFHECDEQDMDLTVPNTYLSFTPDTKILVKAGINGSAQDSFVTWKWENNQKNGIVLSKDPTVVFTFTALNAQEVIYASRQEIEDCVAITWERFDEPHFDP